MSGMALHKGGSKKHLRPMQKGRGRTSLSAHREGDFKIDLIRISDKISEVKRGKEKQTKKPTLLSKFGQRRIICNTVMGGSSRRPTWGMVLHSCPNLGMCRKNYFAKV